MTINPKTVMLIAEDHDFQRRTLVRILHGLGIVDILEAANGREALEVIRSAPKPPEVVLSDLDMPEMDGMAFIRHLGEAKQGMDIIIISALDPVLLGSVAKMADAYGVHLLGIIEKPVTRARLMQLLAGHHAAGHAPEPVRPVPPAFGWQEIRAGIANREFEPFFQPKIEMASGRVIGAEALARWRHPVHGVVAPYAFILEMERHKDIDALTFLMLEKAAHACRDWIAAGFDTTVSVNLSLISLADISLAGRITACVKSAGLEPKRMVLEITETAAMTELAPALENLTRLRMHGFGLSIDDYGTGFASLQQLARVPFTELKIDQGFVTGCAQSRAAYVIVEASIALARGLGLKTVAEGIETEEDWDTLKAAGCDVAQGYFIARPHEEDAFLEFCRKRAGSA
ncbi:MAG: EAL domain-containing response regulator [Betaproteobacteria bacterium]|nr:EAL domain-containing response regulator [Betaproteobacteria bacterium]